MGAAGRGRVPQEDALACSPASGRKTSVGCTKRTMPGTFDLHSSSRRLAAPAAVVRSAVPSNVLMRWQLGDEAKTRNGRSVRPTSSFSAMRPASERAAVHPSRPAPPPDDTCEMGHR